MNREPDSAHTEVVLARLLEVGDMLVDCYPGMTVAQLTTLLRIALLPTDRPTRVGDIVDASAGQKYPTIARQIDCLGDGPAGQGGMGLVEKNLATEDKRGRHVILGPQGRVLVDRIASMLSNDLVEDDMPR